MFDNNSGGLVVILAISGHVQSWAQTSIPMDIMKKQGPAPVVEECPMA